MYCLIVLPSASNTEHLGMYAMPYKLAETEEITWNETGEIAQQCNASKKKNMEMMSVSQKKILQACTHPKFGMSWFGRLIVGFKILWIAEMCGGMMMGEENEFCTVGNHFVITNWHHISSWDLWPCVVGPEGHQHADTWHNFTLSSWLRGHEWDGGRGRVLQSSTSPCTLTSTEHTSMPS